MTHFNYVSMNASRLQPTKWRVMTRPATVSLNNEESSRLGGGGRSNDPI